MLAFHFHPREKCHQVFFPYNHNFNFLHSSSFKEIAGIWKGSQVSNLDLWMGPFRELLFHLRKITHLGTFEKSLHFFSFNVRKCYIQKHGICINIDFTEIQKNIQCSKKISRLYIEGADTIVSKEKPEGESASRNYFTETRGIKPVLICRCSVTQLQPTLCNPMDCSTPGFSALHTSQSLLRLMSAEWWCPPTISSFVIPFSCPQSFPTWGSFLMSRLFASGGQSTGASASASVLPMNIQDWFPLGLTGLIFLQSKGLKSFLQHHSSKTSILWHSAFFVVQLSHPYGSTGKTKALTVICFN